MIECQIVTVMNELRRPPPSPAPKRNQTKQTNYLNLELAISWRKEVTSDQGVEGGSIRFYLFI